MKKASNPPPTEGKRPSPPPSPPNPGVNNMGNTGSTSDGHKIMEMPSKQKNTYIQLFYNGQDEPFICGANGHITQSHLDEIMVEILADDFKEENFCKGAGDYLFSIYFEDAQTGEYGVIEIPEHWEIDEVLFESIMAWKNGKD